MRKAAQREARKAVLDQISENDFRRDNRNWIVRSIENTVGEFRRQLGDISVAADEETRTVTIYRCRRGVDTVPQPFLSFSEVSLLSVRGDTELRAAVRASIAARLRSEEPVPEQRSLFGVMTELMRDPESRFWSMLRNRWVGHLKITGSPEDLSLDWPTSDEFTISFSVPVTALLGGDRQQLSVHQVTRCGVFPALRGARITRLNYWTIRLSVTFVKPFFENTRTLLAAVASALTCPGAVRDPASRTNFYFFGSRDEETIVGLDDEVAVVAAVFGMIMPRTIDDRPPHRLMADPPRSSASELARQVMNDTIASSTGSPRHHLFDGDGSRDAAIRRSLQRETRSPVAKPPAAKSNEPIITPGVQRRVKIRKPDPENG